VLPRSAVRTVDDWYASGMAGTGSNSVVVQDAFVPADRLYPLARWMSGPYSSDREAANPYFQKPVITTFVGLSAAVPLGIAEGAYEAFLHRLPGRMITFTDYLDQRAAPVTHHQLAQARMALETARMHAGATAGLLTDMSLDTGMETRFQSRAHAAYGVEAARDCVDQLFRASGASTILSSVPMQRYQRDIQAMAQHAFLYAPSTMETYGRTLLGLEPNTRFV
jgi:alkylation response protein AidB-like acyl-CoA dehydrogenase